MTSAVPSIRKLLILTLAFCLLLAATSLAQDNLTDSLKTPPDSLVLPSPPVPVSGVMVKDAPSDRGGATIVSWELSADDDGNGGITGYLIYRATSADGPFHEVGDATRGQGMYRDNKASDDSTYYYRVDAVHKLIEPIGGISMLAGASEVYGPVKSTAQWFNMNRGWCLLWVLVVSGSIIYYISRAKKTGADLYVRKIAGIDAVDEAVGRATEMGRKVFFIPGIQDMNDVQTIAGVAILGRVAQFAAEYDTYLEVPVSKSLVMVTARETMKEAYSRVGRSDSYNDAQVHYLTDEQFGYAAAVDGMVVREKPATIFYMGAFFAESLILAETGNAAGAIQIAGTAMPSQLPFFVAACDYTLIGEELFAASAYLSREPRQLGSLKGQDVGKAIFLVAIILGVILATLNVYDLSELFLVN